MIPLPPIHGFDEEVALTIFDHLAGIAYQSKPLTTNVNADSSELSNSDQRIADRAFRSPSYDMLFPFACGFQLLNVPAAFTVSVSDGLA